MPSDSVFLDVVMQRVRAARRDGNAAEVERLLGYIAAEGRPELRRHCERMLRDFDALDAVFGTPGIHRIDGAEPAQPGDEGLCDFCTGSPTVAYYPFEPFSIIIGRDKRSGQLALFDSGDRMFACAYCFELVEAGDWRKLAEWGDPQGSVRDLWAGFRRRRTGPAVRFEPGKNPEAFRDSDPGG